MLTPIQTRTRRAKRALAARGLIEAVTWSFISHDQRRLFGGGDEALELANPIAADMSDMRPSLLPGLIAAAQRNADRASATSPCSRSGRSIAAIGRRISSPPPPACAAARRSRRRRPPLVGQCRPVSVFDVKADALAMLDALGLVPRQRPGGGRRPGVVPSGPVGDLELGPKTLSAPSAIPPASWSCSTRPAARRLRAILTDPAAEIAATKTKPPLAFSDLQPVRRDFAFVVDRTVDALRILKAAAGADRALVASGHRFRPVREQSTRSRQEIRRHRGDVSPATHPDR